MTTSQTANTALLRSLQRVRDRQTRVGVASPSHPQTRTSDNTTTIETITTGPNGEQRIERRIVNNTDQPNPKPQWNTSSTFQPTKPPRSVFLDPNRPVENTIQHQRITSGSPTRSLNNTEVTTPVKVVRLPSTVIEEPSRTTPVYIQHPQQTYRTSTNFIRTDPEVIVLESQPAKRSFFDRFRRNKNYRTNYYGDREVLLNPPESSVYRCCKCCTRGRLASSCPSCYFCELFYGCPLYCWILTFFLLLLPMLALFGWFLSEQPAINPAKRRYVTQQSSIVQNDVYAVMHNCAVPYCTNPSPATTINQLYLTYHDYAATQVTSNGNILQTCSFIFFIVFYILKKLFELSH